MGQSVSCLQEDAARCCKMLQLSLINTPKQSEQHLCLGAEDLDAGVQVGVAEGVPRLRAILICVFQVEVAAAARVARHRRRLRLAAQRLACFMRRFSKMMF